MRKRNKSAWVGILLGCLIAGFAVSAGGTASVLETHTGEGEISLYIKGEGLGREDIDVQIATSKAGQVSAQTLSEQNIPVRTLVMVDNSLSVASEEREKTAELLHNLISDRLGNEEVSIAVFSEDLHVLAGYTNDYGTLKAAVEGIEYQDQETYLTDVLYDLIAGEYSKSAEDAYRRILVVSDGVDNKSIGYTKDELYSLIQDIRIPIYTVGCTNGKNNEELESMFALSRMTSADAFLLKEVEDVMDITDALNRDREIIRLSITPPGELLDGSKKTVKITFPEGAVLSAEVLMPQRAMEERQAESAPAKEQMPASEEASREREAVTAVPAESRSGFPYWIVAAAGLAAIAAAAFIAILVKKRKSGKTGFESIDDKILRELEQRPYDGGERTESLAPFGAEGGDGDSTVLIWNQGASYQVVLTDIHMPAKTYQAPIVKSIVIGRKREKCDIALEDQRTVSARHCEISLQNGRFYVKDLQSANGTYLNGNKVLAETEIVSGNILKLGQAEVRFEVK